MPDIFLSYSREDQPTARKLVAALEAGGCSVWWDGLLEGGERFSRKTAAALEAADVVVVLWSKASLESHWVHDEATHGRDKGRLVPVSIDGSEAPLGFRQFQVLDLAHWKGKADAPEIADVVRAIGIAAGQPDPAPRPVPAIATPTSRRNLILAGSGAALVAVGGGAAAWQWGLFEPAGITNSVAVLPFKNLSGDPKQDYFADGLAEEIRSALARNPLLKVTAAASAATFRDRMQPVPDIARKLGVEHILDGSVRREGKLVRIAVQLVNGQDGVTGWSRTFDEPFKELFSMQARIAQIASDVLTAQVTDRGVSQAGSDFSGNGGTGNAEAFEAYLQGVAIYDRGRVTDDYLSEYAKSVPFFDRAIALDPKYAAAYGGRARAYGQLGSGPSNRVELRKRGFVDAQKCVDLAPAFSDGYVVKGFLWIFSKLNVSGADQFYTRARDLGWGDAKTLIGYVGYTSSWWKYQEAEEAMQRLLALDPLSLPVQIRLLQLRLAQKRFDEALDLAIRLKALNKDYLALDGYFFEAHIGLKNIDVARQYAAKDADEFTKDSRLITLAWTEGKRAEVVKRSAAIGVKYGDDVKVFMAGIHAYLGDQERAIELLDKAYLQHDTDLLYMRHDEEFDEVMKDNPRYMALVKKLGLTGKPV